MFCVLCFYDICDNLCVSFEKLFDGFVVDIKMLMNMFSWIQVNGYYLVMFVQIDVVCYGGKLLFKCLILLMFDDGYESYYMKVFLLFKQFCFFVVFGLVMEWINVFVGVKIKLLDKQIVLCDFFMNWNQICEMQVLGLVEFVIYMVDMYYGVLGNLQGNEMLVVIMYEYLCNLGCYEIDDEYCKCVYDDLQCSIDLIQKNVGIKVQMVVWLYGVYNQMFDQEVVNVGLKYMLMLELGLNMLDVLFIVICCSLMGYDIDIGDLECLLCEFVMYYGEINFVQCVVQVDMDYIYDLDLKQQEVNFGKLIDCIKDFVLCVVYLQVFVDLKGNGVVDVVYFLNWYMLMCVDLFLCVLWQLKMCVKVEVYVWLLMLLYKLLVNNLVVMYLVQLLLGVL